MPKIANFAAAISKKVQMFATAFGDLRSSSYLFCRGFVFMNKKKPPSRSPHATNAMTCVMLHVTLSWSLRTFAHAKRYCSANLSVCSVSVLLLICICAAQLSDCS